MLELAERGGAGATAQDLPNVASRAIERACVSSMEEAGLLFHHHDLHGDWQPTIDRWHFGSVSVVVEEVEAVLGGGTLVASGRLVASDVQFLRASISGGIGRLVGLDENVIHHIVGVIPSLLAVLQRARAHLPKEDAWIVNAVVFLRGRTSLATSVVWAFWRRPADLLVNGSRLSVLAEVPLGPVKGWSRMQVRVSCASAEDEWRYAWCPRPCRLVQRSAASLVSRWVIAVLADVASWLGWAHHEEIEFALAFRPGIDHRTGWTLKSMGGTNLNIFFNNGLLDSVRGDVGEHSAFYILKLFALLIPFLLILNFNVMVAGRGRERVDLFLADVEHVVLILGSRADSTAHVLVLVEALLRLGCALEVLLDLTGVQVPVAFRLLAIAHDLEVALYEVVVAAGQ